MLYLELFLILAVGNAATGLSWLWGIPINSGPVTFGLAIGIYLYVVGQYLRSDYPRPHLRPTFGKLGLAVGAGLLLTLPPVLFFLFPVLVGRLDYTPIKTLSAGELAGRVLVQIPLFTALSEELLFRQYLFERLKGPTLISTLARVILVFTLWHLVVVLRTVLDTNLAQNIFLTSLSYLGGLVSVAVGGLVFGLVRYSAGSFWYSALTHWLNVALMTLTIWLF